MNAMKNPPGKPDHPELPSKSKVKPIPSSSRTEHSAITPAASNGNHTPVTPTDTSAMLAALIQQLPFAMTQALGPLCNATSATNTSHTDSHLSRSRDIPRHSNRLHPTMLPNSVKIRYEAMLQAELLPADLINSPYEIPMQGDILIQRYWSTDDLLPGCITCQGRFIEPHIDRKSFQYNAPSLQGTTGSEICRFYKQLTITAADCGIGLIPYELFTKDASSAYPTFGSGPHALFPLEAQASATQWSDQLMAHLRKSGTLPTKMSNLPSITCTHCLGRPSHDCL